MIADDFLNPGDAVAERLEILFGGAGQDLHERAAADFGRRVGRKARQSGERPRFRRAMRALDARVQDQKNAPIPREVHPRDDRRDLGVRPPAGVDRQAAALEQGDAHARTRAAIEQARILARVEGQSRKPAKRGRDRQRELGPGAESGMRGNGLRDDELPAGIEAKAFGDAARQHRAPLALLAQHLEARRLAKVNAGLERVDGETDRTEPSAKIPGEIKKTQMQAGRRRDLNAFQLRASFPRSIRRSRRKRIPRNIAKLRTLCQAPHATNRMTACRRVTVLPRARVKSECCGGSTKMPQSLEEGRGGLLEDRWAMIELILTVCALTAPSQCDEQRLQFSSQESLMQCMMQAPPYIAQWSDEHPAERVTRWRCAYPGDEKI